MLNHHFTAIDFQYVTGLVNSLSPMGTDNKNLTFLLDLFSNMLCLISGPLLDDRRAWIVLVSISWCNNLL